MNLPGFFQVFYKIALLPVDDVLLKRLLKRQMFILMRLCGHGSGGAVVREQADEVRKRIKALGSAVVNQAQCGFPLFLGNPVLWQEFACMDDRAGEASLAQLVQKHAVKHNSRRRLQPERHIRQPNNRVAPREVLADEPGPLDRLHRILAIFLDARADRQHQRIEQQVFILQAEPVDG